MKCYCKLQTAQYIKKDNDNEKTNQENTKSFFDVLDEHLIVLDSDPILLGPNPVAIDEVLLLQLFKMI